MFITLLMSQCHSAMQHNTTSALMSLSRSVRAHYNHSNVGRYCALGEGGRGRGRGKGADYVVRLWQLINFVIYHVLKY